MSVLTPTVGMRGIWTLAQPFPAISTTIYACTGIRSYSDYAASGKDVFKDIYEPLGLDAATVASDEAAGSMLMSLKPDVGPTIHVPTIYLTRYPELDYVNYGRLILSVDLGSLPTDTPIQHIGDQVAHEVSSLLGRNPHVAFHTLAAQEAVSRDDHEARETARLAAVDNRDSIYVRYEQNLALIDSMRLRIAELEDMVVQLSQVPPTGP